VPTVAVTTLDRSLSVPDAAYPSECRPRRAPRTPRRVRWLTPTRPAGLQPGSGLLRALPDLRGPNLSARRVTVGAEWAASVATPQWLPTIRLESVVRVPCHLLPSYATAPARARRALGTAQSQRPNTLRLSLGSSPSGSAGRVNCGRAGHEFGHELGFNRAFRAHQRGLGVIVCLARRAVRLAMTAS
jgi:hypothetical protein